MNEAQHIAIIMDGNGRWAERQGKKRFVGHEAGAETIRDITSYCSKNPEVKRLSLYAFSTENWKRPKMEVEFLMKLLSRYLENELPTYLKLGVKFEMIGDVTRFSAGLQKQISNSSKHQHNFLYHKKLALFLLDLWANRLR